MYIIRNETSGVLCVLNNPYPNNDVRNISMLLKRQHVYKHRCCDWAWYTEPIVKIRRLIGFCGPQGLSLWLTNIEIHRLANWMLYADANVNDISYIGTTQNCMQSNKTSGKNQHTHTHTKAYTRTLACAKQIDNTKLRIDGGASTNVTFNCLSVSVKRFCFVCFVGVDWMWTAYADS